MRTVLTVIIRLTAKSNSFINLFRLRYSLRPSVIIIVLLLLLCDKLYSQTQQLQELNEYCISPTGATNQYGGLHWTIANRTIQLPNGNFVSVGKFNGKSVGSIPNHGFWINISGDTIWSWEAYIVITNSIFEPIKGKIFGAVPGTVFASQPFNDGGQIFHHVFPLNNGTYIVTGYSESPTGDFQGMINDGATIMLLDSNFNIVWKKNHLCTDQGMGIGSVIRSGNGNFVLCGNNNGLCGDIPTFYDSSPFSTDNIILVLDSNGNKLWSKVIGSSSIDVCVGSVIDRDGYLYVVSSSGGRDHDFNVDNIGWNTSAQSTSNTDIIVTKFDSLGNILWRKSFGTTKQDIPASILYDSLRNVIVLGGNTIGADFSFSGQVSYNSQIGTSDAFVLIMDTAGVITKWKRISGENDENVDFITNSHDGNYVLEIYTTSKLGDFLNQIEYLGNGGSGHSSKMICKLDSNLNYIFKHGWKNDLNNTAGELIQSYDGYIYIREFLGKGYPSLCNPDTSIDNRVVIKKYGVAPLSVKSNSGSGYQIVVYPNPTERIINIKLDERIIQEGKVVVKLIDLDGKIVLRKEFLNCMNIELETKVSGSYIINITNKNGLNYSQKILINKS